MNAPVAPSPVKHRLTLEDVRVLWDRGGLPDYPDIELIDGDIYEMPADGTRTRDWNVAVLEKLYAQLLGTKYRIVPDKTLDLVEHYAPKPDIWIHDKASTGEVTGANVLLTIEISDTTLAWDRDVKAPAYEKGGVREHWRIECEERRIVVYRLRADRTYGEPASVGFDGTAHAQFVPITLRLADLDLPA
jgi:Uma2 family endonuclease